MPVKVVTDSTSDLPPQVAQELGITVVPVYVCFGEDEPLKKRFSLPSLPIPGLKFSYPQL